MLDVTVTMIGVFGGFITGLYTAHRKERKIRECETAELRAEVQRLADLVVHLQKGLYGLEKTELHRTMAPHHQPPNNTLIQMGSVRMLDELKTLAQLWQEAPDVVKFGAVFDKVSPEASEEIAAALGLTSDELEAVQGSRPEEAPEEPESIFD